MACNFRISVHKNSDNLHLRLSGDFDGTSAHQLINSLKSKSRGVSRAFIHTSCLREIYPFGQNIFEKNFNSMADKTISFIFTGEKANQLIPENTSLDCRVF